MVVDGMSFWAVGGPCLFYHSIHEFRDLHSAAPHHLVNVRRAISFLKYGEVWRQHQLETGQIWRSFRGGVLCQGENLPASATDVGNIILSRNSNIGWKGEAVTGGLKKQRRQNLHLNLELSYSKWDQMLSNRTWCLKIMLCACLKTAFQYSNWFKCKLLK